MTETDLQSKKPLAPDEKLDSVMVYISSGIYWGDVVIKEKIRTSTWLRTNSAPDHIHLLNAKALTALGSGPLKPLLFPELHISTPLILAFHLVPPAHDPLDYDLNEPNRRMVPMTVFIGHFRMDGNIRISTHTDFETYIEVTRENLLSIYDVDISCPIMPALGVMKVPFVLIRQSAAIYAAR